MCMHAYDMTGDGIPDLATGWSSGKLDIRSIQTGNIIYKDSYTSHIAGLMQVGFVCCFTDPLPTVKSRVAIVVCIYSNHIPFRLITGKVGKRK